MCDPVTLTVAATAITAAGSVVNGINQKNQANYQAEVAKINADQAAQNRREAIDQGGRDLVLQDRKQAQLQGQQRVALAGSGVDTTFGTAADLANDSALIGSENQQAIVTNTDRQARGFAIQSMNYNSEAVADRSKGSAALTNGLFSAGGTILSGASQVRKLQVKGY